MADSDEEYDRKKRDKFRRERSDYTSDTRSERRRSDHERRSSWREEYSDSRKRSRDDDEDKDTRGGRYRRGDHGGSSPGAGRRGDWSPPSNKRYRREGWESLRDYGPPPHGGMYPMMDRRPPPPWMMGRDGHHGSGGGMPPPPPGGSRGMGGDMMMGFSSMNNSRQRGSTLLTFKQFLTQQDDNIDDADAIRLYHEYKADFKKKQLHQFFNDHKEEDWLQTKYHPNRVADNHKQYLENVKNRLNVFNWFSKRSLLEEVPLISSNGENIVQIMDKAVILMEGGNELDFLSLNMPLQEPEKKSSPPAAAKKDDTTEKQKPKLKSQDSKGSFSVPELSPEHQKLADQAKQWKEVQPTEAKQTDEGDAVGERKRVRDDDGNSSPDNEEENNIKKPHDASDSDTEPTVVNVTDLPPSPSQPPVDPLTTTDTTTANESSMNQGREPSEEAQQPETGQTEVDTSSTKSEEQSPTTAATDNEDMKEATTPEEPKPRHLHMTKAVYIRHIPPQISAADILEVCNKFPGYLRLAFAEPQPEKGYERRGWVTYSASTNVVEVANKLATAKIKGVQLNCQANKDLSRRVKPVLPVTWARGVVVHDIRQLLKIVEMFDRKAQLWQYRQKEEVGENGDMEDNGDKVVKEGDSQQVMEVDIGTGEEEKIKTNPLLNVSESLFDVDSTSSSKEGKSSEGPSEGTAADDDDDGGIIEDDEEGVISDPNTTILSSDSRLVKALDELLWYVRLVHSLDYYNFTHFMEEDHMPHRLGIVSVRPKPPNNISSEEVSDHIKNVDEKVAPLLNEKKELNEEEMEKLGQRDQDTELEKFIDANTQKLGENKYLCPLSGKKFRGTDFVRKHIFNKHKVALEEVKSDTAYFNNYLRDPDRPVPLDGSVLITSGLEEEHGKGEESRPPQQRGGWGNPDPMMQSGYHGHHRFERGSSRGQRRFSRPPRGSGFNSSRLGRRRLQNYEDLDAPVDLY